MSRTMCFSIASANSGSISSTGKGLDLCDGEFLLVQGSTNLHHLAAKGSSLLRVRDRIDGPARRVIQGILAPQLKALLYARILICAHALHLTHHAGMTLVPDANGVHDFAGKGLGRAGLRMSGSPREVR